MTIFQNIPITSPWTIAISIILFVSESVTTFDMRILQAKRRGDYPEGDHDLPGWVAWLYWLNWILKATLLILNWRYGLGVIVVLFILKVLPVLEVIGNVLMAPFKPKGPTMN